VPCVAAPCEPAGSTFELRAVGCDRRHR
jgi:hypothetical protein